jgi:flagellar hook-basal body complex protein FliE
VSIPAIAPVDQLPIFSQALAAPVNPGAGVNSFSRLLVNGVDAVNTKLLDADALVRAFAVDDTIPVHQVTFALEQAKLSLELMLQVRGRVVEAYQQFMNMQL